ncbi:ArnT family glycosyltransferase [Tenacibaculum amylolyticum]|uniref:ArnT family glycosyltransferase n=1 Tax=Tenacibaculum amylolyticum TaxID=104269 RepID=UPI00389403AE
MKSIINSNYLLVSFLTLLFVVNLIQGYSTDLLADEAYYWTYSNELSWGYFDHPPMVAIWISISKLFFSSSELSVRFFSSITLSITFYIVWLLIKHPKKNEFQWLFVLIAFSTSLFNVYGFITVPDTPLLFFAAIFFWGYQKYLNEKSLVSYLVIAITMAGMLYSKYQGILIIFFVLLSNLKVLKDGKIWLTALLALVLFAPHLLWQFENDFPSFKYHLFERKENTVYRFRDTYMHLINMIAIIGFTFPIVYKALFKNLKNKDLFQRALNFTVAGFVIFFFISTFKGHAQAQWIVPISIPLIIIPFNYLIENPKQIRLFKILAFISIIAGTFLRFAMVNDGLLPKQFDMHGNKKWVERIEKKIGDKTPLFLNSYQNTSTYWFYSGKRPYQINTWNSRKNQYDLYSYNQNFSLNNPILINIGAQESPKDSILKKNNIEIYFKDISGEYTKPDKLQFDLINPIYIEQNSTNSVNIKPPYVPLNLSKIFQPFVGLKSKEDKSYYDATLQEDRISFSLPKFTPECSPIEIQIIGTTNIQVPPIRLSTIDKIQQSNE